MKSFGPFLDSKYKWSLLAIDVLFFAVIATVVSHLRLGANVQDILLQPQLLFLGFITVLSLYIFGGYDLDQGLSRFAVIFRQFAAMLVSAVIIVLVNYLFSIDRAGLFGRGILLGTILGFFFGSMAYRTMVLGMLDSVRSKFSWLVLIDEKDKVFFEGDRERLGFQGQIQFFNPVKSSIADLDVQLNKLWSGVVVGVRSSQVSSDVLQILMQAKFSGHGVMDLGRFYEKHWLKVPVYFLDPEWFISSEGFESISHPVALRVKRIFDIILSIVIFVPALPLMLLTAVLVKLESPGPVIYKQIRTGKNGHLFSIYKFRSMRSDAEKDGAKWAQKNDSRITRVGKFIRLTRLDELPQLWNVLKGDMSFVGPRPERPEFNEMLAKEIPFYNLRHMMQPGLTGWAQVLYPYGASVDDSREKLQYELYYAKHYNLMMDLIIFLKTIRVVLFGRGR